MLRFVQYVGQLSAFRATFGEMPGWARAVVLVFALPGLLAVALSIVALLVSLLALLILTVPAYRLLQVVCGGAGHQGYEAMECEQAPVSRGRKPIDVTIIE